MKKLYSSIIVFLLFVLLISCKETKCSSKTKITYSITSNYNVLIVPDLSNRINQSIHPKPISDITIINSVLDRIPELLKLGNRNLNQLDIYKIDFINRGILNEKTINNSNFEINFLKFKNRLKEASKYKGSQLKSDISTLKEETAKIYSYALIQSSGSDVWNYFNETIHSSLSNQIDTIKISENKGIISTTKNKIVLLTDGYIETINKTSGYNLNQDLITEVRTEFLKSKTSNLQKFILSNPQFLVKKTNSDLKNIDVLVLEITDRSLDINGVARFHPTDLEIIKIIWTDWLTKSGAGRVQIHATLSNSKDVYPIIKNFIESK
ncbi:hypothetical protein [Chryseobacterium sp. JAH]|uniref:hypothetical protein n=1 Tax=Chryseobacterium sp. JAH TaxID=1742858 RepID=UPI0007410280|nr:hypothetical protein [Chryseobacterium sp. JAH]KUJ49758.1 hypothetical protein AR685_17595 [Chryseobacterium sp. JAH]